MLPNHAAGYRRTVRHPRVLFPAHRPRSQACWHRPDHGARLRRNSPAATTSSRTTCSSCSRTFSPPAPDGARGARRRLQVPIWLLGSSLYGAELAAHLGLPSPSPRTSHRLPVPGGRDLSANFRPSAQLDKPWFAVAANAIAADTDADAGHLLRSLRLRFAAMARGVRGQLQAPEAFIEADWSPAELAFADGRSRARRWVRPTRFASSSRR